ncbi:sulfite exporter TauE/SafE family protein [Candidatus Pelagibacter sp.]|nr:sulfite exporter TauE/SafE family protein [Candidatus Pelagibacter sp.]
MNNTLLEINNIYFIFLMMAAAVPVGFFAGFFGIGGGLISVPFLFFVFEAFNVDKDYLMHLSVGTAFSITILTATASVLTHRKYKAVDMSIIQNYGSFVIIGVFTGTVMAAFMNTKTLLFFFSVVVYFFGAYLLLQNIQKKKLKKKFSIFPRVIFGFLSGLISAPMGITGAMMNVPILRYFGYPINLAIGSSAAIGFIIALFGSIGFFTSGLMLKADIPLSIGFINIPAFIIFVPITTFMARIGAKTVQDLDRVKTQRLFGVFLYVIGTLFLYRFLVT